MQTISKWIGVVVLAGCAADSGPRIDVIDVPQANDLGVTTLQTQRVDDHGSSVYTLRGLSSDGQQVGSVRLTLGDIADLARIAGGGTNVGSEIVVAVGDVAPVRSVSHETRLLNLRIMIPTVTQFLDLPAVTSTLANQANIHVISPQGTTGEEAYNNPRAIQCPSDYLLSSPVADQCCYLTQTGSYQTIFVRPTDMMVVTRNQNTALGVCNDGGGTSDTGCGSSCIYGPFGFSAASFDDYGSNPVIIKETEGLASACDPEYSGTVAFGNVTGSNPRGQGCPGSSQGDGNWDY